MMMFSKPLWREAFTEELIESLEKLGLGRRFEYSSSSLVASPRDVVLHRLVLNPQPRRGLA